MRKKQSAAEHAAETDMIMAFLLQFLRDPAGSLLIIGDGINMLLEERNRYRAALEQIAKEPSTPHGWAASEALRGPGV